MLGTLDFSNVKEFEPVESGGYDGMTESWELKDNANSDGQHILAKFKFEDREGQSRTLFHRWSLKPQALWRLKRDLIAMGTDPSELEGTEVDIEGILHSHFAEPEPVVLQIKKGTYTPAGSTETRAQNELVSIKAA